MSSVYIQFVTLKKGQCKWTIRYGPVHMDQYIWASRYCFVLTEVFIYSVNTLFVFFFLGFYFNQMYVVLMHTSWTCLCYNRVLLCFRAVMLWRLPVLAEPQLPRPLRSLSSSWKVILHLKKIIICGFLAGKKMFWNNVPKDVSLCFMVPEAGHVFMMYCDSRGQFRSNPNPPTLLSPLSFW